MQRQSDPNKISGMSQAELTRRALEQAVEEVKRTE